jgi:hypothetical protein
LRIGQGYLTIVTDQQRRTFHQTGLNAISKNARRAKRRLVGRKAIGNFLQPFAF